MGNGRAGAHEDGRGGGRECGDGCGRGHGRLEIVCGPMYAGKSTEILKRILWARNGEGKDVLVLKPAFDDRYGRSVVRSHDGLSADATPIRSWAEAEEAAAKAVAVFIDEVQFLAPPAFDGDLPEIVRGLLDRGVDVVCTGIDMDWSGRPFAVTAALLAMADRVVKLTANCTLCGREASKTFKLRPDGERVALGAQDAYQARCNGHWHREGEEGDRARGWPGPAGR